MKSLLALFAFVALFVFQLCPLITGEKSRVDLELERIMDMIGGAEEQGDDASELVRRWGLMNKHPFFSLCTAVCRRRHVRHPVCIHC